MPCRLLDSAICLVRREGPSNAARRLANTSAGTPLRELQKTGCVAASLEAVPVVKGTPKSKGAQNSEPGPRPMPRASSGRQCHELYGLFQRKNVMADASIPYESSVPKILHPGSAHRPNAEKEQRRHLQMRV